MLLFLSWLTSLLDTKIPLTVYAIDRSLHALLLFLCLDESVLFVRTRQSSSDSTVTLMTHDNKLMGINNKGQILLVCSFYVHMTCIYTYILYCYWLPCIGIFIDSEILIGCVGCKEFFRHFSQI